MFYKTLILSGGGIMGIAQLGALARIDYKNFKNIVGTSIGGIIGFLLAIKLTPIEIYQHFLQFDSRQSITFSEIQTFFKTFGFDNCELFIAKLVDLLIEKNVSPSITFEQLQKNFKANLVITGTNVSKHCAEYFSAKTTPDMKVLTAIRITISIPFIFTSVRYNGSIYVDGFVTDNYAVQYAMQNFEGPFFGILVTNNRKVEIKNFETFLYNLFVAFRKRNNDLNHTLHIIVNTSAISFKISDASKRELFEIGYDAAEKYLMELEVELGRRRRRRRHSM